MDFKSISNKTKLLSLFFVLGFVFLGFNFFIRSSVSDSITSEEAINIVKSEFPDEINQGWGQDFNTEFVAGEWYISVAFSGSGRPIVDGKCYRVNGSGEAFFMSDMIGGELIINRINPVNCVAE